MKRSLGLSAGALTAVLLSGCAGGAAPAANDTATPAQEAVTPAAGSYLFGEYDCRVMGHSGSNSASLGELFAGGITPYFRAGTLSITADGKWTTSEPRDSSSSYTTSGTWALKGSKVTIALTKLPFDSTPKAPMELVVPGVPTALASAQAGSSLLIAPDSNSTTVGFKVDQSGTVMTFTDAENDKVICSKN